MNTQLRMEFNQWYEKAYQPPKTRLSKATQIERAALSKWMDGQLQFGTVRLQRIQEFLKQN